MKNEINKEARVSELVRRARMKFEPAAQRDILNTLHHFVDLTPDIRNFKFPDGVTRLSFVLKGTIPVKYKVCRFCEQFLEK